MQARIYNTIVKHPGITTREILDRYPSQTAPKLQGILFDLMAGKAISTPHPRSRSSLQGNAWTAIAPCKDGWDYHVFTLGASNCSICGVLR